jgi:hypothetical protein
MVGIGVQTAATGQGRTRRLRARRRNRAGMGRFGGFVVEVEHQRFGVVVERWFGR